MAKRHYDVIILGRSLGALATAALLARRDFRILLLGQGQGAPTYRYGPFELMRRSSTILAGGSPILRRVLQELSQSQSFRRQTRRLLPSFAFVTPTRRVEVQGDLERFSSELAREYPEVRQLVDELWAEAAQLDAIVDSALDRDVVWSPSTIWELFQARRAARLLPGEDGREVDPLARFPGGHAFRELVAAAVASASDLATPADQLPPALQARLLQCWTKHSCRMDGGERELTEFFLGRITAHGGEVQLDARADRIVVERGVVSGVVVHGDEEPTGAGHVVSDASGELVAELALGDGIRRGARESWPQLSATAGRFVVSVIVRTRALPDALPPVSFFLASESASRNPRRPAVRVERWDLPVEEGAERRSLLCCELMLPVRGPLTLPEARAAALDVLRMHLPFFDRHLLLVDSPHDGLPLLDAQQGTVRHVDRIHVRETMTGPEPMEWVWRVDPPGWLDFLGEPVRGPIRGTLLVGRTTHPGLGQEGQLLAAWTAARIITGGDRQRTRMQSSMWTRLETG